MSRLMICTPPRYCSGDEIEKNEMGWACRGHVGERRGIYAGFWWGNLRERVTWKTQT